MEELKISELQPGDQLDRPLLHASGETLMEAGQRVTDSTLRTLEKAGIELVYRPEPGSDPGEFIHNARNTSVRVTDLDVGHRTTKPLFDRDGKLLMEEGMMLGGRLPERLQQRGIHWIYVRKDTAELKLDQVEAFRKALGELEAALPAPIEARIDAARRIKAADCNSKNIDRLIESGLSMKVAPGESPLAAELQKHDVLRARSEARKDGFMMMYDEAVRTTAEVFTAFKDNREIDPNWIGSVTRRSVGALIEDHDLLLNLASLGNPYSHLISQSLGTTILSIAAAAACGYDRQQVLEMGYCSYLHDIGMLRVPPEVLEKPGRLSAIEQAEVRRHTVHNLDMLERLVGHQSGLTGTVPIVAYQSHERENGSGYPKGRKGNVIHDFAKVLSVCDTYQAMTSPRPWRQPMLPYQAMEQLVLMAARRVIAPEVAKALLRCMSLFPVGSWVQLQDESVARVVAGSGSEYTRPVVSVVYRKNQRMTEPERIDLSEHKDLHIKRPLPAPREVQGAMAAF
jgi:HD-GYP domain-containing protein (c-di-GMP phosphodiesterase class II)